MKNSKFTAGLTKPSCPPESTVVLTDADVKFNCIPDLFLFILQECHNVNGNGPFAVSKGTITENGTEEEVFVITMHGLEATLLGQCNEFIPVMLSGLCDAKTKYMARVKEALAGTAPKGSKIILAGHSFGGMTAQQLAADPEVYENYEIRNVVAIASPLLSYGKTHGRLARLGDPQDVVPKLSYNTLLRPKKQLNEMCREEAHTGLMAHVMSYQNKDAWGTYDAVGVKGGDAVIKLDTVKFFNAPVFKKQKGRNLHCGMYDPAQHNWLGISILF